MNEASPLSERVLAGGAWVLLIRVLTRVVSLTRVLVLGRLLLPADFGLLGIALLLASILETFTTTGLGEALIQRPEAAPEFWDTAWIFGAGRGFVLFALLFAGAPWAADFFGRPDGTWMVRVIGLSLVLRGLSNLSIVRYLKEMTFGRRFAYELGINLTDAAVALPLAFIYRSAWALVIGYVAGQAAGLILSWLINPVKVRPRFDRSCFGELFRFGRWISGNSIMNFFLLQGDSMVVARVLGSSPLGIYQMSYRISTLPATEIAQTISNVAFPAYSQLQSSVARTRDAFLRVLRVSTFLSFPLGIMVILLGPDFIRQALGDKWAGMIPSLRILAVYGIVISVGSNLGPLFNSLGRPDLTTKTMLARLLIMGAAIYPFCRLWGLEGAAATVTMAILIVNPVADWLAMRELKGGMSQFLVALGPAAAAAALTGAAAGLCLLTMSPGLTRLFVGGALALAVYLLLAYVLERRGMLGVLDPARAIWGKKFRGPGEGGSHG